METHDAITKQKQSIAKLERKLAREKLKRRKQETRRKIELGGLVVKAGMDKYSKAVVLGALIDAVESLHKTPNLEIVFKSKGEAAFMEYES